MIHWQKTLKLQVGIPLNSAPEKSYKSEGYSKSIIQRNGISGVWVDMKDFLDSSDYYMKKH